MIITKIKDIFSRRRKYTMKFRKSSKFIDFGVHSIITDASLLSVLLELKEKYDFEIISTKFKNHSKSHITIKCNKTDKQKIFMRYAIELCEHITDVSF